MTDERRRQIEEIVTAMLVLPSAERAARLDSACGRDPELRQEVESLLAQETLAHGFLETPAIEAVTPARRQSEAADDAIAGEVISHYRILEKVGAGGMGVVYKAQDLKLGRLVAIKILPQDLSLDSAAVQRFQFEARAASALNHPHICTIHEIDEHEGKHFIVMELLEGETLKARIAGQPLDNASIVAFAIQMADALAAAHAKNILHRDLKPTNIHLTTSGQIKLLDFGLAKLARPQPADDASALPTMTQSMTAPHTILGTLPYMSPEQVLGREVDPRSDLFSLGVVLYEMSTGRLPFESKTATELIVKIAQEEPPAIESLNPRISAGLAQIVRKCLEKDRERRYASSQELSAALGRLQEGRMTLSRRRLFQIGGASAGAAALLAGWTFLPGKSRRGLLGFGGPRISRLAVLPMANLSGDATQEFFADGMTDLLIADLGQIASLRVISRTSAMQLKGVQKPLPQIAKQLGVDAVITGSVMKSGGQVRITAALVDGSTDEQLWSRNYQRDLTDVLTLQGQVAEAIASEIKARMTPSEAGRLSRSHTIVPAALDAYLQGRYYYEQYQEEPILKSIEYYEEAVRLDPKYAAAYAGLASAWIGLHYIGAAPFEEAVPKAREAAVKALSLDDSLAEAHMSMASVYAHEWNSVEREKEQLKALELNPGSAAAHKYRVTFLRHMGRVQESIDEAKRAIELDPLDLLANANLGDAYLSARRYDLAIAQYKKVLDSHPNDSTVLNTLGLAYVYNHMYEQGIEAFQKQSALDGDDPGLSPHLAYVDVLIGKTAEARKILNRLLDRAKTEQVQPAYIAIVCAALGERTEALNWLDKAFQQHSPAVFWLKTDPRFDSIRQEPQVQDLMRLVGLI
jgi:serine/threonine protein kinase/TolB-like protein/Tfp pilus assembly protein PilF